MSTSLTSIPQNWRVHNSLIGRNIRQYASSVGLNSNDNEHSGVTSYSTRVERVLKDPITQTWTLTLRKIEVIPYISSSDGDVRVTWWTEQFDALIVASQGDADSPSTPPIPRLDAWANKFPNHIIHTQEYRVPKAFAGKVSQSRRAALLAI